MTRLLEQMMEIKLKVQGEKYKIAIMTILLALACFLICYFHLILESNIVFTYFLYVPIVLAALWWKRKGLVIAIFLASLLAISCFFFRTEGVAINDYCSALMLVGIGSVVAVLSERVTRKEEELRNYLDSITN